MAKGLLNARLFAVGTDLTSNNNKVDVVGEVTEEDVTNFGSVGTDGRVWKEVMGGLGSAKITAAGQWSAGDISMVDDALWAARGTVGPWTVAETFAAAVGDPCYLTQILTSHYKLGDQVGKVAPWEASGAGNWPLVRGQIMHPPGTPRTATGTGTARQLGAVPAGKNLYLAAHVLSISGTAAPTITLAVEADNASGFASPVTVATFAPVTVAGTGLALLGAGFGADDWFRFKWTISGTTPSFLFVCSAGIA